jgi:type IV secretion system protein VirB10
MNQAAPPPPPPPPPNMGVGGSPSGASSTLGGVTGGGERLSAGKPMVTASSGRVFLVLAGLIGLILMIAFILLGGDDEKEQAPERKTIANRAIAPAPPVLTEPDPPPPPQLFEDSGGAPPPPIPEVPVFNEAEPNDEVRQERVRSEMLSFNGGITANAFVDDEKRKEEERKHQERMSSSDVNLGFASDAFQEGDAPRAYAGQIEDIRNTIAQGKLIHAVLETAVNTQLPGNVRAIVSRDIYAEAGKNVLIPKGSRLVGIYNTNLFQGQDRVFVVWNRVIRPDGVDMMVNSLSTDALGRSGEEGYMDSRYGQMFSAAIISSILSIGITTAAEEISGGDGTTTQSVGSDGTFTTVSTSSTQAAADSAARIGAVGARITDKMLDMRPRVMIDQGTPINVFVNRDLIFPSELTNGARLLP